MFPYTQLLAKFSWAIALIGGVSLLPGPTWGLTNRLESPGGGLWVEVEVQDLGSLPDYPDGERLYYRMGTAGLVVVDWSPLGLRLTDALGNPVDLLDGLSITEAEEQTGQWERFSMTHGKQRVVAARYNALRLEVENSEGHTMVVALRAFDDGIGFRYELQGDGQRTLVREHSGLRLPTGTTGYLQMKDFPGLYAPNYQDPIVKAPVGTQSPGNSYVLPGLFALQDDQTWLLFHEAGLTKDYYGAHLDEPSVNRLFTIALPHPNEGNGIGAVAPTATLPFNTPWRIFAIGDLATVAETNLISLFAEQFDEGRFGPADWVTPGKSAWSWWSQDTGTPSLQYEYIDFAFEYGWEYVLIDAGWSNWANTEQEIRNLVAYANARDVKLNLWYNSGGAHSSAPGDPRDRMQDPAIRRAEMDRIVDWGIAGIKVDFFFSDKQDRIQQYIGIMEDALERGLLVNFHGATVPRGWSRTFPNLVSTEAVTGAENYKWRYEPDAIQNVRYTYTRNVVGPMDYTPLTFQTAFTMMGITYAHQLALGIVFESGIQHFADRADSSTTSGYRKLFADEPEVAAFLTDLPTAWDESRLLDGHPDTHAVWARRRSDTWYVGGINGLTSPLTTSVDLSELTNRPVLVESFVRGSSGSDLLHSQSSHEADDSLAFTMGSKDGFSLRISPAPITFSDWISRLTTLPAEQLPDADNDADGLSNFLEFVFDRDPFVADSQIPHLPAIILQDGQFYLRFKLRSAILAGAIVIEKSASLDFSHAHQIELADALLAEGNWHFLPLTDLNRSFFRVAF